MKLKRRIQWTVLPIACAGALGITLVMWSGARTSLQAERQEFVDRTLSETLAWIGPVMESWEDLEDAAVRESLVKVSSSVRGVLAVRLVDPRGVSAMSSRGETGVKEVNVRLLSQALSGSSHTAHGSIAGGWVVYKRLLNGPSCRSCHEDDGDILGALAVEIEGREMPRLLRSSVARIALFVWLALVVLSFLLALTAGGLAGKAAEDMVRMEEPIQEHKGDLAVDLPKVRTEEGKHLSESMMEYLLLLREGIRESRKQCSGAAAQDLKCLPLISQSFEGWSAIEVTIQDMMQRDRSCRAIEDILRERKQGIESSQAALIKLDQDANHTRTLLASLLDCETELDGHLARWIGFLKRMGFELDQHAETVGQLIRYMASMSDMADQGRLLGFQAAVQGYGSGTQSRGLTVVAESVERIAEETAESSKEARDRAESLDQGLRSMARDLTRKAQEMESWRGQRQERSLELQSSMDALSTAHQGLQDARKTLEDLLVVWPSLIQKAKDAKEEDQKWIEELKSIKTGGEIQEQTLSEIAGRLKNALSQYKIASVRLRDMMGRHDKEDAIVQLDESRERGEFPSGRDDDKGWA